MTEVEWLVAIVKVLVLVPVATPTQLNAQRRAIAKVLRDHMPKMPYNDIYFANAKFAKRFDRILDQWFITYRYTWLGVMRTEGMHTRAFSGRKNDCNYFFHTVWSIF